MAIITAIKTTITLGSIEVEVFQLEDGTYRYGIAWVEAIGIDKKKLSEKKGIYYLPRLSKSYKERGKSNPKIKVSGISETYISLDMEQVSEVLESLVTLGNKLALTLLVACAAENIERRADKAFGLLRSEEEYNQRLAARVAGKDTRRTLVDCLAEYAANCDRSDAYKQWLYSNVSDILNRALFKKAAKQLCEERKCDRDHLRDTHNVQDLQLIDHLEAYAIKLIDKRNVEPMEAMREAIAFFID